MKRTVINLLIVVLSIVGINTVSMACTNFLITKGASVDGSTMISYAADSHVLYGELYHWPAGKWEQGTMMDVYEWDTGKYLGEILQAAETYNVIGNMNEHQVAIGETTYGGREELGTQKGAIMDYGSLIYIGLQRSRTAREAIAIITGLIEQYGYASSGESFSIADPDEAWILEIIGKGEGEKGAVWVALQIPDGYVSGHANQARITTFPLANGKNSITSKDMDKLKDKSVTCVYSYDVIDFARSKKYFDGKNKNFSFSDTYAPVTFGAARFCEARVWSMFRRVNEKMMKYEDYATGHNLEHRMPLWIKPDKKVSVQDMFGFMRDHYEGTSIDMTVDAGAGPFHVPYRWRPLTWKVDEQSYCNERATATQQTAFSFVSQSRNWLPDAVGGIFWFGVDDAATTVYSPMYTSMTKVPESFAVGYGNIMEYRHKAAFWVFNEVCNLAYTRYDAMQPEIAKVQSQMEDKYVAYTSAVDAAAMNLMEKNPELAVSFLTDYSINTGENTVSQWRDLYEYLFTRYMDGNIKTKVDPKKGYKYIAPDVEQPGYSKAFYKHVVNDTGDKLKVIGNAH